MRHFTLLFALVTAFQIGMSQSINDPEIINWIRNTTGDLYMGDSTDVTKVYYNNNYIFVQTNCIPSYYGSLGFTSVFTPSALDLTFRITRNPTPATTPEEPDGFVGIWNNGAYVASPGDGQYYDPNNQGLTEWARLAWYFEGINFQGQNPTNNPYGDLDETFGHSTPNGQYHYHVYNNAMIADITDSSAHSGIIGFAFDGYPIYGPYGYTDPNDSTSGVTRMEVQLPVPQHQQPEPASEWQYLRRPTPDQQQLSIGLL